VVSGGSKNALKKHVCFQRDWTTCSKYATHSRFDSQHDCDDLYDHLMHTMNDE